MSPFEWPWRRDDYKHEIGRDFYDLEQEARIEDSGVRHVFTPFTPISAGSELIGRGAEHNRLIGFLNTAGQHGLLHGEPGVGKSSLAAVVAHTFMQAATREYVTKRCDHQDTFGSIFAEPLRAAGQDVTRTEYIQQETRTRKLDIPGFELLGGGRERQFTESSMYKVSGEIGASEAARHLSKLTGFMLVDNLDAVDDGPTHRKIGELVKQLSDMRSEFKLLLVGNAQTYVDLIGGCRMNQRSLGRLELPLMPRDALRDIVDKGAKRLRLTFDDEVTNAITDVSAGYPHFAQLLALRCAENAIGCKKRRHIDRSDLRHAMTLVSDTSPSLGPSGSVCSAVLAAAAKLDDTEFTNSQLRQVLPGNNGLNAALSRLASDSGAAILKRIETGRYRFRDARIRCHIRLTQWLAEPDPT